MDYLDFDVEIGAGLGRSYPVSVRSPAGQANGTLRFPFDTLELENALLKLKVALRSSGGTRRKALSAEETDVQAFGRKLFEALLTDDLRSLYYRSKDKATEQRKGLRLRLHIRPAELAGLPWEYLYDAQVPNYLCLSKRTPLVRYLDLAHPVEPLSIAPPLRILAMTSSPSDQAELNIEREQERMRRALGPLEEQGLVSLTWLPGQTARDLQRALQRGPWHIFHFIGHGDYDARNEEGVLALANDQGRTALLFATQLASLLSDHDALRLTILNACNGAKGSQRDIFSSTAATLARFGLPAVLAMQEEITDDAATEWTHAFYEALATGLPVDAAVAEARLAITLTVNNSLEWGTPVLYLRATDGMLFHLSEAVPPPEPATVTARGSAVPAATSAPTSQHPTHEAAPAQPPVFAESSAGLVSQPTTPAPVPQKTKKQWMEEGLRHHADERYVEALEAYERALNLNPKDAYAWTKKGNALASLQRYVEALEAYERALNLNRKEAAPWTNKGNALYSLQRYQEALAAYERALELNIYFAAAWNGKGNALYSFQRYQEALAAYERALELNPKYAFAWDNKANALERLGRTAEAQQARQKARELGYSG